MGIEQTEIFQVRKIIRESGVTPEVLLENTQSGLNIEVTGKILEAQFRVNGNFLLLLTEGNPFEEALYIYYLSPALEILDFLELSAMYAGGMLDNIVINSDGTIGFSFFDKGERWALKILPTPEYTICANKFPVKKSKPFFKKSWLRLGK